MSNPFDQFSSDLQGALPPVAQVVQTHPSMGAPMSFPPQAQQGGYGGDPYGGSQPMYSAAPIGSYSQQGPVHSGYGPNSFENSLPIAPAPFQSDSYSSHVAHLQPSNQPPSMGPTGFSEIPPSDNPYTSFGVQLPQSNQPPPVVPPVFSDIAPSDAGNPFAVPGMDTSLNASQFAYGGQPNMPQAGTSYTQPGLDFSQRSFTSAPQPPPMVIGGQPPSLENALGMPPQPPAPEYAADSWGGPPSQPPQQQPYGVMQQQQAPPFGIPPQLDPNAGTSMNPYLQQGHQTLPPQPDPNAGALVPSQQQSNPYAQQMPYGQLQPTQFGQDPYGQQQMPPQPLPYGQVQGYGMMPPPPTDPYSQQPQQQGYGQMYANQPPSPQYQQQPPPPLPVDPFSVFNSQPKAPEPNAAQSTAVVPYSAGPNPAASDDDFWGSFGAPEPSTSTATVVSAPAIQPATETAEKSKQEEEKKGDDGNLPPGGEFYDARIFTPTLGVMFFKPQELTDSLFLNTDRDIVDSLAERPVVAFIVEGSSARAAGVELGHVLLKVNGIDVKSPKEASRLIKEGPRPLPLLFYVPNTDIVTAEGEHMVKYDTRETTAPNSAKDWKPKYVVIGGIIAQPWMMNMYRSKSEYDIAVIETQARRPVSVKVKQFSLQGARIQNDWQGPQMVKYKNKVHPWKFIVVLPVARNPIKISSPNLSQLKPVHEGIRRVLLAQQRDRGGPSRAPASNREENYGRAYNGYSATPEDRGYVPQQATAAPARY